MNAIVDSVLVSVVDGISVVVSIVVVTTGNIEGVVNESLTFDGIRSSTMDVGSSVVVRSGLDVDDRGTSLSISSCNSICVILQKAPAHPLSHSQSKRLFSFILHCPLMQVLSVHLNTLAGLRWS